MRGTGGTVPGGAVPGGAATGAAMGAAVAWRAGMRPGARAAGPSAAGVFPADPADAADDADEAARLLYVAMTRAKSSLVIHYNGNYLESIKAEGIERVYDREIYPPPEQLAVQLTHRDVWLDYFMSVQHPVSKLTSGDALAVDGDLCRDSKGRPVLKFSRQFMSRMESLKQSNYAPVKATARFIVYWQKENTDREIRIILPEIIFERTDGQDEAKAEMSNRGDPSGQGR